MKELEGFGTMVAVKTSPFNRFLVFNAKKPTQTTQNWFGLNWFLVWSGSYEQGILFSSSVEF